MRDSTADDLTSVSCISLSVDHSDSTVEVYGFLNDNYKSHFRKGFLHIRW